MGKLFYLIDSYLFIKKIDLVEVLWVGVFLSFEEVSKLLGILLFNIMDIV